MNLEQNILNLKPREESGSKTALKHPPLAQATACA